MKSDAFTPTLTFKTGTEEMVWNVFIAKTKYTRHFYAIIPGAKRKLFRFILEV